jgi:hypothetical protein
MKLDRAFLSPVADDAEKHEPFFVFWFGENHEALYPQLTNGQSCGPFSI